MTARCTLKESSTSSTGRAQWKSRSCTTTSPFQVTFLCVDMYQTAQATQDVRQRDHMCEWCKCFFSFLCVFIFVLSDTSFKCNAPPVDSFSFSCHGVPATHEVHLSLCVLIICEAPNVCSVCPFWEITCLKTLDVCIQ